MYPPVKQLDTRRREAEEWIAVREARRIAKSNSRPARAGLRWFTRLANQGRSLLLRPARLPDWADVRPDVGRAFTPELPRVHEQRGLSETITIRPSRREDRD